MLARLTVYGRRPSPRAIDLHFLLRRPNQTAKIPAGPARRIENEKQAVCVLFEARRILGSFKGLSRQVPERTNGAAISVAAECVLRPFGLISDQGTDSTQFARCLDKILNEFIGNVRDWRPLANL